ncbi:hypothetical protein AGMMS49942_28140 [Spirochaetia bacterium]|nr:hypothetical protein AGMMS49942_28140 [Spirochaetia bacterium]
MGKSGILDLFDLSTIMAAMTDKLMPHCPGRYNFGITLTT